MTERVVVVGAGHAGVAAAVALAKVRQVVLLGGEDHLPYERPPLSKRLLYGDSAEPVLLRSADYWARSPIELRTGERVIAVDPAARTVRTDRGATLAYADLVWAAGGAAAGCGLPGEELAGVHTLRDLADLASLRGDLAGARSAVVVGGGYVGLEAAAALRTRGVDVTVVEVAPRLLARATGALVSGSFASLHRRHGVDVRLGTGVERILERDGRAVGVRLGDGGEVAADVVLVGVGMRPRVAPLLEAGAAGDATGVEVDAGCRTSVPGVHAIGDCVRQRNAWWPGDAPVRVESVHNAGQQAAAVARTLAGEPPAPQPPPRFWSTQFDHELKTVGFSGPDDTEVLRGDPDSGSFSVAYLREGRLVAIDCVNRARDFARAQALIAARWSPPDPAALADADLPRLEPALA